MANFDGSPTPDEIAVRAFSTVRRGLDPHEVRVFLETLAHDKRAQQARVAELEERARVLEDQAAHPQIDEATIIRALGDETAMLLANAKEAARKITARAEEAARETREAADTEALETRRRLDHDRAETEQQVAEQRKLAQEEAAAVRDAAIAEAAKMREAATDAKSKAEQNAREALAEAHNEATALRRQADEDVQTQRKAAEQEAASLVAQATAEAERLMGEAQTAAQQVRTEADEVLVRRSQEADAEAERVKQVAHDEARHIAHEAQVAAEFTRSQAVEQAALIVGEARSERERILGDLTRRRRTGQLQVEQLRVGRTRLLEAYAMVRRNLDEVTRELHVVEEEARAEAERVARDYAETDRTGHDDGSEGPVGAEVDTVNFAALGEGQRKPKLADNPAVKEEEHRLARLRLRSLDDKSDATPHQGLPLLEPPSGEEGVRVIPATEPSEEDAPGLHDEALPDRPRTGTDWPVPDGGGAAAGTGPAGNEPASAASPEAVAPAVEALAEPGPADPGPGLGGDEVTSPADGPARPDAPASPGATADNRAATRTGAEAPGTALASDEAAADDEDGEPSPTTVDTAAAAGESPSMSTQADAPSATRSDADGPAVTATPAAGAVDGVVPEDGVDTPVEGAEEGGVASGDHAVRATGEAADEAGSGSETADRDDADAAAHMAGAEAATEGDAADGTDPAEDHGDTDADTSGHTSAATDAADEGPAGDEPETAEHPRVHEGSGGVQIQALQVGGRPRVDRSGEIPRIVPDTTADRTEQLATQQLPAQDRPDAAPSEQDEVDSLFARIRAEGAADSGETPAVDDEEEGEAAPTRRGPDGELLDPADEAALQARDEVMAPMEELIGRRMKRVLQDLQNNILTRMRGRRPTAESVLGERHVMFDPLAEAIAPVLADSAMAGARLAAPKRRSKTPIKTDDLVDEVCAAVLGAIRIRVEKTLEGARKFDDPGVVAQVNAVFRDWRGDRITRLGGDAVATAFARGAYVATPTGMLMRWVPDDAGRPCADCDDNALAGATKRGDTYPTGQRHPPAHAGCRCWLVRVESAK